MVADRDRQGSPDEGHAADGERAARRRSGSAAGAVAEGDRKADQASRRKRAQRPPESHVARALRSAYEETIQEQVPDEFLDLLGKLS